MERKKYRICLSDGTQQNFILDVSKRKRLSMTFVDKELVVRVPYGCTNREINDFIQSNTDWIKKNKQKILMHIGLPKTYQQGEKIRLLGNIYEIYYQLSDKFFEPYLDDKRLVVAVNEQSDEQYKITKVDEFITQFAENMINICFEKAVKLGGKAPQKLTIKAMSSRWGSCTGKGNIAVNLKVVQFLPECIEYVCIHELCHLEHMDHSRNFWAMVESFCPNWKNLRKKMND